jgi:hypothetical protein
MALTNKQRSFVEYYFACNYNATEAAKRAGYSENRARVEGSELLRHPEIEPLIRQRLDEIAMSAEEAIAHESEIARGAYADYFTLDKSGHIVKFDYERMKADGKFNLVKKIKPTQGGYELEFHDRQPALQAILKVREKIKDGSDLNINLGDIDGAIERGLEKLAAQRKT